MIGVSGLKKGPLLSRTSLSSWNPGGRTGVRPISAAKTGWR
jgi:hypothetical protein